ncbi:hypothetical protein BDV28DRAFT_140503 [Aspergillus coremiiformis]|uniref:Uncharacterized protein n=1 Tax=Aspergillus coremiiformis TaxID=138285 RepID=A0A5N6Z1D0_9EURO|nr:hypothetical protein BDV28DRAFT_140503 [Aspergillus coremiiformis]
MCSTCFLFPLATEVLRLHFIQVRTLAVKPRLVTRRIRPGYMSGGETILMIQQIGKIGFGFKFVTGQRFSRRYTAHVRFCCRRSTRVGQH